MQNLVFPDRKAGLNILCLGAHCDDIEIGCGGALLRLISEYPESVIRWVVFTSSDKRKKEATDSAGMFLNEVFKKEITVLNYRDGYLPAFWSEIKTEIESVGNDFRPDVIFTHYRKDLHQDHRMINELTWNTFRNHFILEYEIPKYDGDMGTPNFFIPLTEYEVLKKLDILKKCYPSQLNKHWFDDGLLKAIMRIRGVECVSESGFAEAFYTRKIRL